MATDYKQKAMEMYDPSYNIKRQGVIDTANQNVANLEGSKGGINSNYDLQVKNQGIQNSLGKNNFSNTMLGRGMGRSTIVGTGLAGMDDRNKRVTNEIDTHRTNDLGNVDNQIAYTKNSMNSNLNSLMADRESGIMNLANQLQQYDDEKAFRERQQAFQEQQAQQEMAYKYASLNKASTKATKPTPEKPGAFYQQYLNLRESNPDEAGQFLKQNAGDVIDRYGNDYYQQVAKEHNDFMDNYSAQQKKKQSVEEDTGVSLGQHLKNLFTRGDGKWW